MLGDAGRESCENHVSTDFAVAHSLVWKHSSKEAATCYRSVLTRGQPYAGRGKTALLRKCRELAPTEPVPPIPVGTSVCCIVFVKHLWLGTWEDAQVPPCPAASSWPPRRASAFGFASMQLRCLQPRQGGAMQNSHPRGTGVVLPSPGVNQVTVRCGSVLLLNLKPHHVR